MPNTEHKEERDTSVICILCGKRFDVGDKDCYPFCEDCLEILNKLDLDVEEAEARVKAHKAKRTYNP